MPTNIDERRLFAEDLTRKIAHEMKDLLNLLKANGWGITIFAFDFTNDGESGALAYLSTASRTDMIKAIKEWLAYQESGLTTGPPGPRGQG